MKLDRSQIARVHAALSRHRTRLGAFLRAANAALADAAPDPAAAGPLVK